VTAGQPHGLRDEAYDSGEIFSKRIRIRRSVNHIYAVLWNRNYFLRFRFRLLKSYGSGSTRQKVTVPTVPVPVPVPQHCIYGSGFGSGRTVPSIPFVY
jgi:hypothetical protein